MAVVKTEKLYMQLNAAELEAIIKKDSPSSNDRDAGFCSASSESEGGDDLAVDHARDHTSRFEPTSHYGTVKDKSELLVRNKRKSMEPTKVVDSTLTSVKLSSSMIAGSCMTTSGPLKKRIRYTSSVDSAVILTPPTLASPIHRNSNLPTALEHDWDASQVVSDEIMPNPAHIFLRHPGVTTLHCFSFTSQPEQQEPLALVAKKVQFDNTEAKNQQMHSKLQNNNKASIHKKSSKICEISSEPPLQETDEDISRNNLSDSLLRPQQRNYKNMTRERRIEANARERTRVHTISAAYETLRRAVPAYASSQKLSKLSVLRVACSYILTLSRMAGEDYSFDQSEPTIADCIDAITSTIQTEGKLKRKKDE